jgi:uncharacterized membrane protein
LRNDLGGAIGAVLLMAGVCIVVGAGRRREIVAWVRVHWRSLLTMEVLFLLGFALWAFVRANNPEIEATEKPMELAFLNSILRSPTFPPRDPWLSGYGISYYYFGYVLLAFLARLTGTPASIAFNLGNAMWWALTALGTYSLLYNLLARRDGQPRLVAALLGPLFVLITGNLEAILDVLHSLRVFWTQRPDGTWASAFWSWLNIEELTDPPGPIASIIPTRPGIWWWRASRVVHDVNFAGLKEEVIDEFPSFSFLLADNHPHLLALPFALMAIAFALQLYLAGRRGAQRLGSLPISREHVGTAIWAAGLAAIVLGVARAAVAGFGGMPAATALTDGLKLALVFAGGVAALGVLGLSLAGFLPSVFLRGEFWVCAWLFGSLVFLNTWDFPIYLSLALAVVWWNARGDPLAEGLKRVVASAAAVAVAAVLFYLPWYPTFRSQAGGILPNLAYPTRFSQFFVMFGTALVPIVIWLIVTARGSWKPGDGRRLALIAIGVPVLLSAVSWALGGVIAQIDPAAVNSMLQSLGVTSFQDLIRGIVARRLGSSWTALGLGALVGLSGLLLLRRARRQQEGVAEAAEPANGEGATPFLLMLIGLGALLVVAPEFVYLKDGFGTRMNTIFKFYFAAWILWGVAGAYAMTEIWPRAASGWAALRALAAVPVLLGLFYPILATWTKANQFQPPRGRTLDGSAHLAVDDPADWTALQWINVHLPSGVLAEAIGGSYTSFGRVSANTGLPTVLGWPFHEWQWRGSWLEQGTREQDIETLYLTRDPVEARTILDRYGIAYVYIGPLERSTYRPLVEAKFATLMDVVYQDNDVVIYARRGLAIR